MGLGPEVTPVWDLRPWPPAAGSGLEARAGRRAAEHVGRRARPENLVYQADDLVAAINDCHCTPPPDSQVAVISERDIVRALADGADPDAIWAADVGTEEPRYVTPSHPVPRLAEEMLAAGVRHMPVVDDNEVVGMVGARDALRSLTEALLARTSPDGHRLAIDLERELAYPGG